jgi:hypothetical protein
VLPLPQGERVFLPYILSHYYGKERKKLVVKNPSPLVGEGAPAGRVRGQKEASIERFFLQKTFLFTI